jgi:hypothetical protein
MKIVVTYESTDITRLIKQDLALQGITATDGDIKFTKNQAVVTVEVSRDEVQEPATPEALGAQVFNAPAPPPAPPLAVVEGGASPADMSDLLRASQKTAATNPGKFPTPERQFMDGESLDFPGGKR